MVTRRSIYNPVLQSVLASAGNPFNLAGLAKATKLPPSRAYGALARLLEVGIVEVKGERRSANHRGRGERVYALVPGGKETPGGLLARTREIVGAFASANEFTTTDVVEHLGRRASGWPLYNASSVRLALELLEAQNIVVRVIELATNQGRGRSAYRWTSNPANMTTQRRLADLARQHVEHPES